MMPLKIALIGAGLIGKDHVSLIQNSPKSQLAGICDVTEAAEQVAASAKTNFYHDLSGLLKQEKPDGMIIASPNGLHAAHARICAEHHIPMLIEKPVAGTLADARQIERLVAEQDAKILIGHYRRFNPLVEKAKSLLDDGVIGKPVGVSVMWILLKPDDYFNTTWRIQRPNGGPALINLIHDIDCLRYMLGEVESVFAFASHQTRGFDVEDTLSISLKFQNGTVGTILVSDAAASPWAYETTTKERDYFGHSDENCYHIVGTDGALAFPQLDVWQYRQASPKNWQHALECRSIDVEHQSPMQGQFDHFLHVISGDDTPRITATDGLHSLAVVFAILESAEHNRPISMQEILNNVIE